MRKILAPACCLCIVVAAGATCFITDSTYTVCGKLAEWPTTPGACPPVLIANPVCPSMFAGTIPGQSGNVDNPAPFTGTCSFLLGVLQSGNCVYSTVWTRSTLCRAAAGAPCSIPTPE
jgi:hypothetical protein